MIQPEKLSKYFYLQDLHSVALKLLGKIFVRKLNGVTLSGKIVEVEAYCGFTDEASHSYKGKTQRNKIMFEEGGLLYVYFTYGMHYCANVVTGSSDEANAVLIRAIEPINGIDVMILNRYGNKQELNKKEMQNLVNGPAKICEAFSITKNQNGADLSKNEIYILDAPEYPDSMIVKTTRIGIKKSVDLPWRYYIKENSFISAK